MGMAHDGDVLIVGKSFAQTICHQFLGVGDNDAGGRQ